MFRTTPLVSALVRAGVVLRHHLHPNPFIHPWYLRNAGVSIVFGRGRRA